MSLPKNYVQAPTRIPDIFSKIRDGQAPDQVSQQTLKDWGFKSSNDRALLPLLKTVGFLSPDGKPTSSYHEYRDHSVSKAVIGRELKRAYKDLFLIKEFPSNSDKAAIQGKFKSYHNVTDRIAGLMTKTFYALLDLADLKVTETPPGRKEGSPEREDDKPPSEKSKSDDSGGTKTVFAPTGLHYNVQIHLPATKDIEVYNAIFKSLKEHLFNE